MWTLDTAYCIRTNSTVDSCGVTVVKNWDKITDIITVRKVIMDTKQFI